jgi:hypothetical protein
LETTLQSKTDELNQTKHHLQDQLEQAKEKNQVKCRWLSARFLSLSLSHIHSAQDLLTTVDQLKAVSATNDVRILDSNGMIMKLNQNNEVSACDSDRCLLTLSCASPVFSSLLASHPATRTIESRTRRDAKRAYRVESIDD